MNLLHTNFYLTDKRPHADNGAVFVYTWIGQTL